MLLGRPAASVLALVILFDGQVRGVKRTNRDWAHMTDADWNAVEKGLEEPDERAEREAAEEKQRLKFERAKNTNMPAGFDLEKFQNAKTDAERQKILGALKSTKPKKEGQGLALGHVFVTVRNFTIRGHTCCNPERKAITELAKKWSSLLASTGMDAAFSIWKDDQIGFETKHEDHVKEVTSFCLQQPEAALVRHDLEDEYGPAADAEWIAAHEKMIADREAAKQAKIEANKKQAARRKQKEEKAAKKRERKEKLLAAKAAAAAGTSGEQQDREEL